MTMKMTMMLMMVLMMTRMLVLMMGMRPMCTSQFFLPCCTLPTGRWTCLAWTWKKNKYKCKCVFLDLKHANTDANTYSKPVNTNTDALTSFWAWRIHILQINTVKKIQEANKLMQQQMGLKVQMKQQHINHKISQLICIKKVFTIFFTQYSIVNCCAVL